MGGTWKAQLKIFPQDDATAEFIGSSTVSFVDVSSNEFTLDDLMANKLTSTKSLKILLPIFESKFYLKPHLINKLFNFTGPRSLRRVECFQSRHVHCPSIGESIRSVFISVWGQLQAGGCSQFPDQQNRHKCVRCSL